MKRSSLYVTMGDGVRLALDVWLPRLAPGARLPAILHQTRYYRRVEWAWGARAAGLPSLLDVNATTRRRFVEAGYAWVDLDVRGSGASFGRRPCPWWRDEVRDGARVVDWIVKQIWSNGRVGAMGVSYGGTSAEMLLVNQHPAVLAVAPRFSLFDVYADIARPGGLHLSWFTEAWARTNEALDQNQFPRALARMTRVQLQAARDLADARGWRTMERLLGRLDTPAMETMLARLARLGARGVPRTDEDAAGELLRRAVAEHKETNVHEAAARLDFRDDSGGVPEAPDSSVDLFSPHAYLREISGSGAAVYSYSGWLDGAYQRSAAHRHMNLDSPGSRLILGPWDHGGRQHVSPAAGGRTDFDHDAELLRFFGRHLGVPTETPIDASPVRYFTMVEERWKGSAVWPPPHEPRPWSLAGGGGLTAGPAKGSGAEIYRVDTEAGTGRRSRWNSLVGLAVPLGYGDRRRADERLLCFTSPPLAENLEVTGHPALHLFLEADAPDAAVFAYLEDVAPSGRVTYVTEGLLRALHRAVNDAGYRTAVPARGFRRKDALPLHPGEPAELLFDLLPTSYLFRKGHSLRLSLAGADRDHFTAPPNTARHWKIHWGEKHPSRLILPIPQ